MTTACAALLVLAAALPVAYAWGFLRGLREDRR